MGRNRWRKAIENLIKKGIIECTSILFLVVLSRLLSRKHARFRLGSVKFIEMKPAGSEYGVGREMTRCRKKERPIRGQFLIISRITRRTKREMKEKL